MKLARRLAVFLIIGIAGVMVLNAYLRLGQESAAFQEDSLRDLRVLGRGLGSAVEAVWRVDGEERARKLVEDVNVTREDVEIRWIDVGTEEARAILARLPSAARRALPEPGEVQVLEGADGRYSYTAMSGGGPVSALLEIVESRRAESEFLRASLQFRAAVAVGMIVVASLIVIAIGYWFVGLPMRQLIEKARRVGAGDLSHPLVLSQRDEIGELAKEINAMCDRLAEAKRTAAEEGAKRIAAIEQLRHADRLKTVGQLASGVAHELGTPLNVVSGHARMIAGGEISGEEARASAEIVVEQSARMTDIIRQLLDFSRRRGAVLGTVDLREVVSRTLGMLAPLADRSRVRMVLGSPDAAVPIRADENQVRQALANVVVNAFQAMRGGGELRVMVGRHQAVPPPDVGGEAETMAVVEVVDRGPGIAAADLPHVFEPFFTTKAVGEGAGLGLAVAYGIMREHGGWIAVDSRPGEGSRFTFYFKQPVEQHQGVDAWTRTAVAS